MKFVIVMLFGVSLLAGCTPGVNVSDSGITYHSKVIAGYSVEGRPIATHILGKGRDVSMIIATIHGDEYAGTPIVNQLVNYLQEQPALLKGKRVVIIPVANPDGKALGQRGNANGIDLNRNFSAANRRDSLKFGSSMSEPESRVLARLIEIYAPNRIVSIHQPFNIIDYDGPGQGLANAMSDASGMTVKKLGSRPGSLGSYAGVDRNIPIITLELPKDAHRESDTALWEKYGQALIAAVTYSTSE